MAKMSFIKNQELNRIFSRICICVICIKTLLLDVKIINQYTVQYEISLNTNNVINVSKISCEKYVNEMITCRELQKLLQELQKAYIQRNFSYNHNYMRFEKYIGNKQYELQPEDLERVTFYLDTERNDIYFLPESGMAAGKINGENEEYIFCFKKKEVKSEREIIPQPDTIQYYIAPYKDTEMEDRLIELGTVERAFPDSETIEQEGWLDNSLIENEYMSAVKDMVHGTLLNEKAYGDYEVYIGEYRMTDFPNPYEEKLGNKAVEINAAVICLNDGYGFWCGFYASDFVSEEDIEIFYHVPITVNVWEDEIARIMADKRLIMSLKVEAGDNVEVPDNPFPFVMLPILDFAVGDGRFPENAEYTETMTYY